MCALAEFDLAHVDRNHQRRRCRASPGRAKRNGVFKQVHIAYPAKYASCRLSHGVSRTCPLQDSRGLSRSCTTSPLFVSIATRESTAGLKVSEVDGHEPEPVDELRDLSLCALPFHHRERGGHGPYCFLPPSRLPSTPAAFPAASGLATRSPTVPPTSGTKTGFAVVPVMRNGMPPAN